VGALATVPAAFLFGSAAMRSWLSRAPRSIALDLAQPLPVVTAWHAYGAVAFAILALTIVLATGGLIVAVRRHAADASPRDGFAVVAIAAVTLLAAGSWPVVFSSDVYAYAAYGAQALAGQNPYALVGAEMHGPFVDAARWQWSGAFPRCVYGPLFTALAREGVSVFAPAGVAATLGAFRIAAGLAFVAGIALVDRVLSGASPRTRFVLVAAYGLNPVSLWTVAEGHNDAFLMLAVAAGAALAVRGSRFIGTATVALSPLLKAPGLLLAALVALDALAFRRPERRATVLGLGLGTALATAVALPPLLPALTSIGAHGRYAPEVSLQGLVGPVAALLLAVVASGTGLALIVRQRRSGYALIGIAVVAALPNPYPWYAPWLVPLSLAAGPEAAGVALWAATISSVARYLPDAVGTLDAGTARFASLAAALPILWALTAAYRNPFVRKKVVAQP
jgi:hypothetical protein